VRTRGRGIADCGSCHCERSAAIWIGDWQPRAAGPGHRGDGRRAIAPNKPNFGGGKSRDKCLAGKELWLIAHSIGLGQTKPISEEVSSVKCSVLSRTRRAGSPLGAPSSNFTLHTSNSAEGRSCETKPIPRLGSKCQKGLYVLARGTWRSGFLGPKRGYPRCSPPPIEGLPFSLQGAGSALPLSP
jgi:hypothetical protein